ncbi:hypothetical protein [Bacillus sp. ISL-37]|uniref:hypothetical protein n=1 Tax=Bacillus sp. ISL-37 TaxID=2819123 RepID=UPI001BEA126E|nr:hypothetical protein [Bacillus sp. ISL-37]
MGKKGRNIFEPTVDKMIPTGEKSLLNWRKISFNRRKLSQLEINLSTVEIFELSVGKSVSNPPSSEKTSPLLIKLLQQVMPIGIKIT